MGTPEHGEPITDKTIGDLAAEAERGYEPGQLDVADLRSSADGVPAS